MSAASSALWRKNPVLAWREIDGETVIVSPNDNTMHELNDTGSFLWRNIDGQRNATELAKLLVANYEVTAEVALADTQSLLQEMSSRKLVVPAHSADGGKA